MGGCQRSVFCSQNSAIVRGKAHKNSDEPRVCDTGVNRNSDALGMRDKGNSDAPGMRDKMGKEQSNNRGLGHLKRVSISLGQVQSSIKEVSNSHK